jgi:hypothetical protein
VGVGLGLLFGLIGRWEGRRRRQCRFEAIPYTTTEAQERTRIAMEDARRNTQLNPPPVAPSTLSSRLAQLDAA